MPITDQLLDQLLAYCKFPEDLMGEQGLLRQLQYFDATPELKWRIAFK